MVIKKDEKAEKEENLCLEINQEELEENSPEINSNHPNKKFFIFNSLQLFIYSLIFAGVGIIELFFKSIFKQHLYELDYDSGGVWIVLAIVIIICGLTTFIPKLGKSMIGLALSLFLILTMTYNQMGLLNELKGFYKREKPYYFFGSVFLACGFANFIASFFYCQRKGFNIAISNALYSIFSIAFLVLISIFYERRSDRFIIYIIYFVIGFIVNVYISLDFKFMGTVRKNRYTNNDVSFGFIDSFSDIFFRFWIDIFKLSKNKNEYEN